MNSKSIVVEDKKTAKSGWVSILATEGETYTLPPKSGINLEVGQSYDIDYFEKEQEWGTSRIIKKVKNGTGSLNNAPNALKAHENPVSSPSNGNGHSKYTESEIKGFEAKQRAIGMGCALNNSCLMAQAYAAVIASAGLAKDLKESEIRQWIASYQEGAFTKFKEDLGL